MRTVKPDAYEIDRFYPDRAVTIEIRINHKAEILRTGAGRTDDIHVFKVGRAKDTSVLVLTVNPAYGYAGLEEFTASGTAAAEVFIDQESELPWGTDFFEHAPINQAKALLPWL